MKIASSTPAEINISSAPASIVPVVAPSSSTRTVMTVVLAQLHHGSLPAQLLMVSSCSSLLSFGSRDLCPTMALEILAYELGAFSRLCHDRRKHGPAHSNPPAHTNNKGRCLDDRTYPNRQGIHRRWR